jgi:hypothetical protein
MVRGYDDEYFIDSRQNEWRSSDCLYGLKSKKAPTWLVYMTVETASLNGRAERVEYRD